MFVVQGLYGQNERCCRTGWSLRVLWSSARPAHSGFGGDETTLQSNGQSELLNAERAQTPSDTITAHTQVSELQETRGLD